MKRFISPSLPRPSLRAVTLAGAGGFLAVACLAILSEQTSILLLMAPFGASCVLLFSAPQAPLSQPLNVVGGHVVATLIGLILRANLPPTWWAMALAVGLAIAAMVALRITHPPAGADPIVVFTANPGFGFLYFPVFAGAVMLVLVAILFHRLCGVRYPAEKS